MAGSKLQKEVARTKGLAKVRFVSAEWAVESVKAGRRLAEGPYLGVGVAPVGTARVDGMFARMKGAT